MQNGNLDLVLTLVPIIGVILGGTACLHREMRRGFDRCDKWFDRLDERCGLQDDTSE